MQTAQRIAQILNFLFGGVLLPLGLLQRANDLVQFLQHPPQLAADDIHLFNRLADAARCATVRIVRRTLLAFGPAVVAPVVATIFTSVVAAIVAAIVPSTKISAPVPSSIVTAVIAAISPTVVAPIVRTAIPAPVFLPPVFGSAILRTTIVPSTIISPPVLTLVFRNVLARLTFSLAIFRSAVIPRWREIFRLTFRALVTRPLVGTPWFFTPVFPFAPGFPAVVIAKFSVPVFFPVVGRIFPTRRLGGPVVRPAIVLASLVARAIVRSPVSRPAIIGSPVVAAVIPSITAETRTAIAMPPVIRTRRATGRARVDGARSDRGVGTWSAEGSFRVRTGRRRRGCGRSFGFNRPGRDFRLFLRIHLYLPQTCACPDLKSME